MFGDNLAEKTPSFANYVEAERKGTLYTKALLFSLFSYINTGVYGMSALNACYNMYYKDNWDPNTYFFPYYFVIPYIRRDNLPGFFAQLILGMYGGYSYVVSMTSNVTFFLSCCFYIEASCQEFRRAFTEIDDAVKNNAKLSASMRAEIRAKIRDCILFHIKIMQWVCFGGFRSTGMNMAVLASYIFRFFFQNLWHVGWCNERNDFLSNVL